MNFEETWENYVQSWKTQDPLLRKALFAKSLASDCCYHDPIIKAQGWDALTTYMEQFHQQIQGGHFVTQEFLSHSNKSVARWEMRDTDNIVLGNGISYGEYDSEGRLYAMTGFFQVPENASS